MVSPLVCIEMVVEILVIGILGTGIPTDGV